MRMMKDIRENVKDWSDSDEVHAYLEGDEQIYSVEIPAELYQWAEAYVLTHYVAIKKTKRRLKNWHEAEKPGTITEEKSS